MQYKPNDDRFWPNWKNHNPIGHVNFPLKAPFAAAGPASGSINSWISLWGFFDSFSVRNQNRRSTGGLYRPYKGRLPALPLKGDSKTQHRIPFSGGRSWRLPFCLCSLITRKQVRKCFSAHWVCCIIHFQLSPCVFRCCFSIDRPYLHSVLNTKYILSRYSYSFIHSATLRITISSYSVKEVHGYLTNRRILSICMKEITVLKI